jgi:ParB/Sulfiredoxin domain
MQTADRGEASPTLILQTTVQLPVRLIESAPPSDSAGVRALFDSILRWGILQPLIVRRIPGSARYQVLAGCKRFASAMSAGFSEVPCVVFEGSDAEAAALTAASNISPSLASVFPPAVASATAPPSPLVAAVLRELQATRSAVAENLRLIQSHAGGLRRRIAGDLLDIEIQRACWIIDGLQILNAAEDGSTRSASPVKLGPMLRSLIRAFQPECSLSAIDMQLGTEPAGLSAAAYEPELRWAINCAVGALLTSMHDARQADAALSILGSATAGAVVISIVQNVVPFQELARLRSGPLRGELPQGEGALTHFGLESAKRAVERQGGRLELHPEPSGRGGAIDLKLPAASARD